MKKAKIFVGLLVLGIAVVYIPRLFKQTDVGVCEVVQQTTGAVNLDRELDYIIEIMQVVSKRSPQESLLASDVINECERLRTSFKALSNSETKGSIDFLLQIHEDATTGQAVRFDPSQSRKLISDFIQKNKYEMILMEGSSLDGFSPVAEAMEIFGRLKYEKNSPLASFLRDQGVDVTSPMQTVPKLVELLRGRWTSQNDWRKIEADTSANFVAGESLPFTALMAKLVNREFPVSNTRSLITSLSEMRSAYVVTKALRDMQATGKTNVAIVYGFVHEDDFRSIISKFNVKARICNTTGVDSKILK
ncbi:MAG: hypothetical protein WCK48_00550 [bacterium]